MSLALCHCGKEWRAQRGVLVAYSLLVFVSLCLGFLLVPEHWWQTQGKRALSLSWFVAAGVIGVFGFVAPQLVRAEFAAKEDQFVRRLPGALGPSFTGKVLFLLLATLALPLVGLLWGELFLQAIGQTWSDLFTSRYDGEVVFEWPWPVQLCCALLLLAPWVWAIGTWLPGGRMAVGGTLLLVLVLGLCVVAVLRQSPHIEKHLAWEPWLWAIVPLGVAIAGVSWVRGRRGGGATRSARLGVAAMAVGLAPPALWLGHTAWDYRHPDLQRLATLSVQGITPDARYVLAGGAAHAPWCHVHLRIDLQTGEAVQLTGIDRAFTGEWMPVHPWALLGQQRWWRSYGDRGSAASVLDLATGDSTPLDCNPVTLAPRLTAGLRTEVLAELRATTKLRAPGDWRAWFEDDELCFEEAGGAVSRMTWPKAGRQCYFPAGHGFRALGDPGYLFDLTNRRLLPLPGQLEGAFFVRGELLACEKGRWQQSSAGSAPRTCEPLTNARVLGLFDDDRLLCAHTAAKARPARLFLVRPADGAVTELAIAESVSFQSVGAVAPMHEQGSVLARDPRGRIWLRCSDSRREIFLLVDAGTLTTSIHVPRAASARSGYQLLAWPGPDTVLLQHEAEILRVDVETGALTVLFPKRD
ncbi:MAG TPA: hypothetical protein VF384_05365 [Planctomycetota bacterium]